MKRTKNRFDKLELYNEHNISGLKILDGKELKYQYHINYKIKNETNER